MVVAGGDQHLHPAYRRVREHLDHCRERCRRTAALPHPVPCAVEGTRRTHSTNRREIMYYIYGELDTVISTLYVWLQEQWLGCYIESNRVTLVVQQSTWLVLVIITQWE